MRKSVIAGALPCQGRYEALLQLVIAVAWPDFYRPAIADVELPVRELAWLSAMARRPQLCENVE